MADRVLLWTIAGTVCDLACTTGGSHIAAVTHSQSDAAGRLQVWQAESAPPESQYILDASIRLSDHPTAVAWLPSCAVCLTVAVACSDTAQIFSQSHGHGWVSIATLGNLGQPMRALHLGHNGLPLVTAGNQLGLVSNLVQAHPSSLSSTGHSQLLQIPLGQLVLELGGPLPDYAPAALALLTARGRMHAAREACRHLLSWLKLHDSSLTQSQNASAGSLQQHLLPDVPLDALLDKPYIGALSSLVGALPLSHSPTQLTGPFPTGPKTQQQQQQQPSGSKAGAPDTAHAARLLSSSQARPGSRKPISSPAPADPYAFDAGAFGMDDNADKEEEEHQAQPAAAADPFASDAGAFDMGQQEEKAEEEQQAQPAAAPDPYAFDAGAFGMAHEEKQEEGEAQPQPAQATAADPYAFDAGAFGMSSAQPEEDEGEDESASQPAAAPAADPFAFDPGAFGFSGEEQPQQPQQASASVSAAASATASDPFAFNPDAFGFGGEPQAAQSKQSRTEEDVEARPQVAPAESSASDPFAFNPGAFGMDVSPEPDQHATDEESAQHGQQAQPGSDPFAFGPAPSTAPSLSQHAVHKPQPATRPPPPRAQDSSKQSLGVSSGRAATPNKSPAIHIHRPKQKTPLQSQPAFLSSSELGYLQKMLGAALSQAAGPNPTLEPVSPNSPVEALIDLDPLGSPLPPGLTPQTTQTLLGITQMLCDDPPQPSSSSQQGVAGESGHGTSIPGIGHIPVDWPALDNAAQKAVRAIQLAVCSMQSTSGTFWQQARLFHLSTSLT